MKITRDFIEFTDKLTKALEDKKVVFGNGNVLLAKLPVETKTSGGLHLPDEVREDENKRRGFGRVIAIPNNLDTRPDSGDIPIKPGDFIWFVHVAENPVYYAALSVLTGVSIPKETVFYTGDNEIIAKVSSDQFEVV